VKLKNLIYARQQQSNSDSDLIGRGRSEDTGQVIPIRVVFLDGSAVGVTGSVAGQRSAEVPHRKALLVLDQNENGLHPPSRFVLQLRLGVEVRLGVRHGAVAEHPDVQKVLQHRLVHWTWSHDIRYTLDVSAYEHAYIKELLCIIKYYL